MDWTWVIAPRCRVKEEARKVEGEGEKEKEEGRREKEKTHRFMTHPLKSSQCRSYIKYHQSRHFIRMIKI